MSPPSNSGSRGSATPPRCSPIAAVVTELAAEVDLPRRRAAATMRETLRSLPAVHGLARVSRRTDGTTRLHRLRHRRPQRLAAGRPPTTRPPAMRLENEHLPIIAAAFRWRAGRQPAVSRQLRSRRNRQRAARHRPHAGHRAGGQRRGRPVFTTLGFAIERRRVLLGPGHRQAPVRAAKPTPSTPTVCSCPTAASRTSCARSACCRTTKTVDSVLNVDRSATPAADLTQGFVPDHRPPRPAADGGGGLGGVRAKTAVQT